MDYILQEYYTDTVGDKRSESTIRSAQIIVMSIYRQGTALRFTINYTTGVAGVLTS